MRLGTEVDLSPGHIVLDGAKLTPERGTTARPSLFGPSLLWPVVAHLSYTAELLLYGISYLGHPLTSTENFTEIVPGEPLRRGS